MSIPSILNVNGNGARTVDDDDGLLSSFITPTDEARAVARPGDIDRFYIEDEYQAAQEEQADAHAAKGEEETSAPAAVEAETEHAATKAKERSDELAAQASEGRDRLKQAEAALDRHSKRPRGATLIYWITRLLILGGDIAGIGGAALLLGEQPIYAFLQAVSAAVSAITLGGIGRELRHLMAATERRKPLDELTDDEKPFASWFAGPSAESYVKIVALACASGIVLIAGGIFALRGVTEGMGPAIAFGAFALALGLASLYASFTYGDEVADHLDSQRKTQEKRDKQSEQADGNPVIGRHARANTETASIRARCEKEGQAAAAGIQRQLYRVLNSSPGVAGNGTAARRSEED